MEKFAKWLNVKFLEWQLSLGERKTVSEFAKHIGVPQPSLSEWMAGKYGPRYNSLAKLADKFGPEVYDVLDVPRPLPLNLLESALADLPGESQSLICSAILQVVPTLVSQNITDKEQIAALISDAIKGRLPVDE